MTGPQRRLEDPELVRIELPLDDRLPQPEGGVDEDHVGEPAVGIEGEHDAGAAPVARDHLLDRDRQEHAQMVEPVLDAIDDGAIGEDRGEAAPARGEQRGLSPDAQKALVLAREAGLGKILRGGARADGHRGLVGSGFARERPVGGDDRVLQPGWERGRLDEPAELRAGRGQRGHVLAGDPFEDGGEPVAQAVAVEERPVRVRGDREPVGNANPGRAELAVQLPEGRRLAADQGHVSQPDLPEPLDGLIHTGAPRSA